MSPNIPFEIQIEILKNLPIKSLIQYRSVSKTWKSLIDSSEFIAHYTTQPQNILLRYENPDYYFHFISIPDDDTFPHKKVSFTIHKLVDILIYKNIIGISHGLLCLYWRYLYASVGPILEKGMAVIWNPAIRKAVAIIVPNTVYEMYKTIIGFGVCRQTADPKIVKIISLDKYSWWVDNSKILSHVSRQIEVFALSEGVWRRPYGKHYLPRNTVRFPAYTVVVDHGICYWLADEVDPVSGFSTSNMIVSFDMTSEEFKEIKLPDSLALANFSRKLYISKLRESLIVFECDDSIACVDLWMMENDGVSNLFTKLYTVNTCIYRLVRPLGFRKSGECIFEAREDYPIGRLVVYDPYSKQFDDLGFVGSKLSFKVSPYKETLLLLDHPDLIVYNEDAAYKYQDGLLQRLNSLPV